jgi:2-polyprenyl-6-methoxyphenol hydroxylase-like FAD-dependent oxidoreductase
VKVYSASERSRSRPHIYAPPFSVCAEDIKRDNLGLLVWQEDLLEALGKNTSTSTEEEEGTEGVFTIDTRANTYDAKPYNQEALTAILAHDYSHDGEAVQYFYPHGALALLPLADRQSFLIWTRKTREAQHLLTLAPENFMSYLREHLPEDKQAFSLASPLYSTPLSFHFAPKIFNANKLLMGAAAHRPHPLAGQGFNICVEDVRLLCATITAHQKLGLEPFTSIMLKEYSAARRAHAGALVGCIDVLARLPLLSNPFAAAALDFFNLTPTMKRTFAAAGAGLLHNLMASSTSNTGTPSTTR